MHLFLRMVSTYAGGLVSAGSSARRCQKTIIESTTKSSASWLSRRYPAANRMNRGLYSEKNSLKLAESIMWSIVSL